MKIYSIHSIKLKLLKVLKNIMLFTTLTFYNMYKNTPKYNKNLLVFGLLSMETKEEKINFVKILNKNFLQRSLYC